MKACMGKVLVVDLGSGTMEERAIGEELYRDWLGGIGLAARLLWDIVPEGADPLGPDNALAFMTGLLCGTGSVMTGRWMVATKSPLTGGWGDANCGGNLAPALKKCGWDGVIFTGVSEKPVRFVADDSGARLEDASELWGLDAIVTEERILAGAAASGARKPAVACIGPAAERLSLISGISNDGGRYAARSGVGAVMGSKKLKALVVSGTKTVSCADPAAVKAISKSFTEKLGRMKLPGIFKGWLLPVVGKALGAPIVAPVDGLLSAAIFKKWGTIYNNVAGMPNGDSPVLNWGGSVKDFPHRRYMRLDPDRVIARETKKYSCYSCVIGCGGICSTEGLGLANDHQHKPEYETCCAFGALIGSDDLDAIFRINDFCNRSGLDTISAGNTAAFAIECFENGVLDSGDTGGLELRWGDAKAVEALLRMMAARQGFGDTLADGVKRAAERMGKGAERYAVHAGGQEPGMHDSRMDPMMGVSFACDPTPGRHTVSAGVYFNVSHLWEYSSWVPKVTRPYPKASEYAATEEEALKSVAGAALKQVLDAAGGCLFALTAGLQHWNLFGYLDAATGVKRTGDEYLELGKRIQTLRQAFSVREGVEPRENLGHPRLRGEPPLGRGPLKGRTVPLEAMASNYWKALGWDETTGKPSERTVAALGVEVPVDYGVGRVR